MDAPCPISTSIKYPVFTQDSQVAREPGTPIEARDPQYTGVVNVSRVELLSLYLPDLLQKVEDTKEDKDASPVEARAPQYTGIVNVSTVDSLSLYLPDLNFGRYVLMTPLQDLLFWHLGRRILRLLYILDSR